MMGRSLFNGCYTYVDWNLGGFDWDGSRDSPWKRGRYVRGIHGIRETIRILGWEERRKVTWQSIARTALNPTACPLVNQSQLP